VQFSSDVPPSAYLTPVVLAGRSPDRVIDSDSQDSYTGGMDVHFKPETESRLHELASTSGRPADDLVEDAMAGYLAEVADVRQMPDGRYHAIQPGRVKPIDGC